MPDQPAQEVPIACSLDAAAMDERMGEWDRLLPHVVRRERLIGGQKLVFEPSVPVADIAALAAAERDCCQFFTFVLTIDRTGTALEVTAPSEADALVEALLS